MKYGDLPDVRLNEQEQPLRGFLIKIRNPPKTAVLRLPTPEETLERMNAVRQLSISSGNRQPKISVPTDEAADRAFFKGLRVDSGAEFDDAELAHALFKLTSCQIGDCEENEAGYEITLEAMDGNFHLVHVMGEPTIADLKKCRDKLSVTKTLGPGRSETRFPPDPGIRLYDKVVVRTDGYADGYSVPPDHKYAVILALINKVNELDSNLQISPNF